MTSAWTLEKGVQASHMCVYTCALVHVCACWCPALTPDLVSSPWLEKASLLGSVIICFHSPLQLFWFLFLLREHTALIG